MSLRALVFVLLVLGCARSSVAQPFVYVGTSGSQGHLSLCTIFTTVNICESSALELHNAATGTALKAHRFGVYGLGGYSFTELVAAGDGRRVYAITMQGVLAVDVLEGRTTRIADDRFGLLELSRDGTLLYFVNGEVIHVIDTASLTETGTIALPESPQDLAMSPDGAYLYASHALSDTVSKISTASRSIVGTLTVRDPGALAVSPDNTRLYALNMGLQTVTVLDAASGATNATVSTTLPIGPFTTGNIVVSSTTAYVSGLGSSNVLFIDVATNTVARVVTVTGAEGQALSGDGRELFVAGNAGVVRVDAVSGATVGSFATASPAISVAILPPVPCLYESVLTPGALTLAGGHLALTIPAPASCGWTISGGSDWIAPSALSGSGPSAVDLTVASAQAPRTGAVQIGAQELQIQQTSPEVHADLSGPVTLTEPATVTGWAIDRDSSQLPTSSPGIDAVHVWAYPLPSGAPIFVGPATYGAPRFVGAGSPTPRPDVGLVFGAQYADSGFHLGDASLPPGTYDLVVFARSTVTSTFNNSFVIRISVQ